MDIGVTKACNAKCIYCYGIFQKMTGEIVPADVLYRLFQDAPKLGIKSLTLTGDGEPTLNPGVYNAVTVGKANGLDIGFATNGIALTSDKIKVLLNSCTWLRFNLSAADQLSYKTIHGVDAWNKVQANIWEATRLKRELGSKCTIGLQMVLIPEAEKSVLPESLFAIATGVDYFVIKQYSDPGCKEMSPFDLDRYDEMQRLLKVAAGMSTERTQIIPKFSTIAAKGKRPYDNCVDCPLIFQISGNGKCYPCGFLFGDEEYCYGDLNKQSLQEILDSDRYWRIIHYMRHGFNVHTQCKGSCRHDKTNEFIWNYLQIPEHLNFI
jgi:radical SAM protein with 4Fe4S-binding SPASM domain